MESGVWNSSGEIDNSRFKIINDGSLGRFISEHADYFKRSLNIEKGEIAKFVLIQTPERETHNRILIVIHHIAVDGVSWRILLEDLELLLTGIQNEESVTSDIRAVHTVNGMRHWSNMVRAKN